MTSPLEREILTHYWTSPAPFPRSNPLIIEIIARFVELEIFLIGEDGVIRGNSDALRPYMEALSDVPLPYLMWTVGTEKINWSGDKIQVTEPIGRL